MRIMIIMRLEDLVTFFWLKNNLKKLISTEVLKTFVYALLLLGSIVLLRLGLYIVSRSKWLTEVIPLWLVILSALIGFVSVTLLIQKKILSRRDIIIGCTGIVFSLYGLSIGYRQYSSIFFITLFAILCINLGLIILRMKRIKRLIKLRMKRIREVKKRKFEK